MSFGNYSRHSFFFCHADQNSKLDLDMHLFDAIGIHYSIRLPFDQISPSIDQALQSYQGLKFLFIQDEYDFPQRTHFWINRLKINLVFTVVPPDGIETVYPSKELPGTRFVSNLTGYVPETLPWTEEPPPPSTRSILIGYRGRPLPIRYGKLGVEKIEIGRGVKQYCTERKIECDIEWTEHSRIYGPRWYEFVGSCRSMLGSESGSNVFDWDGTLNQEIEQFRRENSQVADEVVYQHIIEPKEIDGLMNQVSPRVFEAIASRTVLVLFEGNYSNVMVPDVHFIPLKKDFSNLGQVIEQLQDNEYIDGMARRAWHDIILSKKYSYQTFVNFVDDELEKSHNGMIKGTPSRLRGDKGQSEWSGLTSITTRPLRASPPPLIPETIAQTIEQAIENQDFLGQLSRYAWGKLPKPVRQVVKPRLMWVKERIEHKDFLWYVRQYLWQKLPQPLRKILKPWLIRVKERMK
jgi:hypothetical protein